MLALLNVSNGSRHTTDREVRGGLLETFVHVILVDVEQHGHSSLQVIFHVTLQCFDLHVTNGW